MNPFWPPFIIPGRRVFSNPSLKDLLVSDFHIYRSSNHYLPTFITREKWLKMLTKLTQLSVSILLSSTDVIFSWHVEDNRICGEKRETVTDACSDVVYYFTPLAMEGLSWRQWWQGAGRDQVVFLDLCSKGPFPDSFFSSPYICHTRL